MKAKLAVTKYVYAINIIAYCDTNDLSEAARSIQILKTSSCLHDQIYITLIYSRAANK